MSNIKSEILKKLEELYESGQNNTENIKNLVYGITTKATNYDDKNIESINRITKEIFIISITIIHEKKDISKDNIQAIIEGLMSGLSCSKEQIIRQLHHELLVTKYYLEEQKGELFNIINETLSSIYSTTSNFTDEVKTLIYQTATEIKLKNIEILGLMEETLQQSIQLAINEGKNVEQHVKEITQSTLENALKADRFSKQRIQTLAERILTVAINTAELAGKEIETVTSGTVIGLKQAIINDIERLKATINSSYRELSLEMKENSNQIITDLKSIDETFISVLNQLSYKVSDTAWEILMINIKAIKYNSSKIQDIANETAELLMQYLQKQGNEISQNTQQLTKIVISNVQNEVADLAHTLFKITNGAFLGMLDGAKEVLNKNKNNVITNKIFPDLITKLPEAGYNIDGLHIYISHTDSHEIWFLETDIEIDYPPHTHKAQWGIVLEGTMEFTMNGLTKQYSKGDRYYIPEGVMHSIKMSAGYAEVFFLNDSEFLNK